MVVNKSPFESEYGFKGPGFTVDDEGNIIARSITLSITEEETAETPADFVVTEENLNFVFSSFDDNNPTITLSRGRTYIFDLELETLNFTIFQNQISGELVNTGLNHSDGSIGVNAQSKGTGRLVFTVPTSLPDSIFYGSTDQINRDRYLINVIDPDGSFDTVTINSNNETTNKDTGALIVAGGAAVQGNLFVNNDLYVNDIISDTNLKFDVVDDIVFLANDSSIIGKINSSGSTVPMLNTTIENTAIGSITPAAASFTVVSATNNPVNDNDLTNKKYVDTTVTALTIALGM